MKDAMRKFMVYRTAMIRSVQYDNQSTIHAVSSVVEAADISEFIRRFISPPAADLVPQKARPWTEGQKDILPDSTQSTRKQLGPLAASGNIPAVTAHLETAKNFFMKAPFDNLVQSAALHFQSAAPRAASFVTSAAADLVAAASTNNGVSHTTGTDIKNEYADETPEKCGSGTDKKEGSSSGSPANSSPSPATDIQKPSPAVVASLEDGFTLVLDSIWREDFEPLLKSMRQFEKNFASSLYRSALCGALNKRRTVDLFRLPSFSALKALGLLLELALSAADQQRDVWTGRFCMVIALQFHAVMLPTKSVQCTPRTKRSSTAGNNKDTDNVSGVPNNSDSNSDRNSIIDVSISSGGGDHSSGHTTTGTHCSGGTSEGTHCTIKDDKSYINEEHQNSISEEIPVAEWRFTPHTLAVFVGKKRSNTETASGCSENSISVNKSVNEVHKKVDTENIQDDHEESVPVVQNNMRNNGIGSDDNCGNTGDGEGRFNTPPQWYLSRCLHHHVMWNRVPFWEDALTLTIGENEQYNALNRRWNAMPAEEAAKEEALFRDKTPCISVINSFAFNMVSFGILEPQAASLVQKVCLQNNMGEEYAVRLLECLRNFTSPLSDSSPKTSSQYAVHGHASPRDSSDAGRIKMTRTAYCASTEGITQTTNFDTAPSGASTASALHAHSLISSIAITDHHSRSTHSAPYSGAKTAAVSSPGAQGGGGDGSDRIRTDKSRETIRDTSPLRFTTAGRLAGLDIESPLTTTEEQQQQRQTTSAVATEFVSDLSRPDIFDD
eukprot:Lankesteria_metandrocarpae@DN3240_c0_g1_i1.p1